MIDDDTRQKILPAAYKKIQELRETDDCSCEHHEQHAGMLDEVERELAFAPDVNFDAVIHILFDEDRTHPAYVEYLKDINHSYTQDSPRLH